MLKGATLAGAANTRKRIENDFYATETTSTRAILDREKLIGTILEPAAGSGHISKVLREYYPNSEITSTDLIEREDKFNCNIQSGIDFLTHSFDGKKFDNIITNPPFELAQQFIERAWELSNDKIIMFAKIQLLEGTKRREMFERIPLKYVYVFSKRQNPLRNGNEFDEKGKPWASTMCFAWFVWQHNSSINEPMVRWI